ncbi:MAG: hypothetical protein P8M04_12365, partial [Akkermansiaceae bacterium]|nr:hypothetical protein [Akkermansiaceae bacterium]
MVLRSFFVACCILLAIVDVRGARWARTKIPTRTPEISKQLWARCFLQVPDRLVTSAGDERDLWRSSTVIAMADLPGKFEVFLNGKIIIKSDGIPLGEEQ